MLPLWNLNVEWTRERAKAKVCEKTERIRFAGTSFLPSSKILIPNDRCGIGSELRRRKYLLVAQDRDKNSFLAHTRIAFLSHKILCKSTTWEKFSTHKLANLSNSNEWRLRGDEMEHKSSTHKLERRRGSCRPMIHDIPWPFYVERAGGCGGKEGEIFQRSWGSEKRHSH